MYELPTTLNVGGVDYAIRTDYREVLDVISALSDADYSDQDKIIALLSILYVDGRSIPTENILNDAKGADVALTASTLTYDDVISLYFSVKPEYRTNSVWLMNDTTAMTLRKLKDADGNFLWNANTDTIFGKQVIISEFMPNAEPGSKPIAFGDFSYYWVICRKPVSVRTIKEKFVTLDQIGYLAFEFLDGKLIRPDAVKVIQMS